MNEQTKQLVDKFANDLLERSGYDLRTYEPFLEEAEKLVHAVVRECAGIDFRHRVGMTVDQDFDTSCAIMEHFGVEQ